MELVTYEVSLIDFRLDRSKILRVVVSKIALDRTL